jgi:thioredoxin-like negative regulator of GroEL
MKEIFAAASAAIDAGDLPAAEMLLRQIVETEPRAHAAWDALAIVALHAGEPEMALARAQRAVELERRNPFYRNTLGVALGELGRFEEAQAAFRYALRVKPVYPQGLFNLSKALLKSDRASESLAVLERAYAIEPDARNLRYQLAFLYRLHGRPQSAIRVLDEVRGGLDTEGVETYAMCLLDVAGGEAACEFLRQHIAERPTEAHLRNALGRTLLAMARWEEGWLHFRALRQPPPRPLAERLDGKAILCRSEQGLGDILFFLRFADQIRERGARLVLTCPQRLAPIVAGHPFEVVADPASGIDEASFDWVLAVGDLPLVLRADSTPPALRLQANPEVMRLLHERFASLGPPPYLGLTWRAGTDTLRRQEFGMPRRQLSKEVPPARLGEAVRGWRGTLLSVQRNPYPGETAALGAAAGARVHDFAGVNDDLSEALAVMSLLDDYAAVSNTNVHLRAGLGRTARVLVPRPPEWRWMNDGAESPWFPGFRIYRQPVSRDWREPLAVLRRDLGLG